MPMRFCVSASGDSSGVGWGLLDLGASGFLGVVRMWAFTKSVAHWRSSRWKNQVM